MNTTPILELITHMKALPPIPEACFHELGGQSLMYYWKIGLSCGTVGCIRGEFAAMRGVALGSPLADLEVQWELTRLEYDHIVHAIGWVGEWRSLHASVCHDPNLERDLMIAYLQWIADDPQRFSNAVLGVKTEIESNIAECEAQIAEQFV